MNVGLATELGRLLTASGVEDRMSATLRITNRVLKECQEYLDGESGGRVLSAKREYHGDQRINPDGLTMVRYTKAGLPRRARERVKGAGWIPVHEIDAALDIDVSDITEGKLSDDDILYAVEEAISCAIRVQEEMVIKNSLYHFCAKARFCHRMNLIPVIEEVTDKVEEAAFLVGSTFHGDIAHELDLRWVHMGCVESEDLFVVGRPGTFVDRYVVKKPFCEIRREGLSVIIRVHESMSWFIKDHLGARKVTVRN